MICLVLFLNSCDYFILFHIIIICVSHFFSFSFRFCKTRWLKFLLSFHIFIFLHPLSHSLSHFFFFCLKILTDWLAEKRRREIRTRGKWCCLKLDIPPVNATECTIYLCLSYGSNISSIWFRTACSRALVLLSKRTRRISYDDKTIMI